jgi:hypothetical protein
MLWRRALLMWLALFLLPRKSIGVIAVFLGLISFSCFGQPAFFAVASTPYDRQMNRVQPVLNSGSAPQYGATSSSLGIYQWMAELRAMPYRYSGIWETPAEVSLEQAADCKGKAVALYAQMRRSGARSVRIVIGKRHIYDSATHAWLEWQTSQGTYTLDPTFNEVPIKTAELDPMTYVPFYAFDGEHKYRATHIGFGAPASRVATGYGNRSFVPAATNSFVQPGLTGVGSQQFFRANLYNTTTTHYSPPNPQPARSNVQPSAVQRPRQFGTTSTAPSVSYAVRSTPTLNQNVATARIKYSTTSSRSRRRHARNSTHHGRRVVRTQIRHAEPRT